MKIIKVSTELEMSVHEFPSGTIREHNKALCELSPDTGIKTGRIRPR